MRQKLEYIRHNLVERGFFGSAEHGRWSSARNYAGQPSVTEVDLEWSRGDGVRRQETKRTFTDRRTQGDIGDGSKVGPSTA